MYDEIRESGMYIYNEMHILTVTYNGFDILT